jgi:hypothetical protein
MSHRVALRNTEKEAFVTAKQTLEHYFAGRNRREHLTALKAIAIGARWSEIRSVLETNLGKKINDGSLKNIVDALQASFLIKKRIQHTILLIRQFSDFYIPEKLNEYPFKYLTLSKI